MTPSVLPGWRASDKTRACSFVGPLCCTARHLHFDTCLIPPPYGIPASINTIVAWLSSRLLSPFVARASAAQTHPSQSPTCEESINHIISTASLDTKPHTQPFFTVNADSYQSITFHYPHAHYGTKRAFHIRGCCRLLSLDDRPASQGHATCLPSQPQFVPDLKDNGIVHLATAIVSPNSASAVTAWSSTLQCGRFSSVTSEKGCECSLSPGEMVMRVWQCPRRKFTSMRWEVPYTA